jgi:hypothetical protein
MLSSSKINNTVHCLPPDLFPDAYIFHGVCIDEMSIGSAQKKAPINGTKNR